MSSHMSCLDQYFTGRFSDPNMINNRIGYLENKGIKCKIHSEDDSLGDS